MKVEAVVGSARARARRSQVPFASGARGGVPPHVPRERGAPSARARLTLWLGLVVAVAASVLVAADGAPAADADYVRLMRGMAAVKGLLLLPALWAVDWRLRQAVRPPLAAGYAGAVWAMAAAPALIWGLQHVAAASVLFHGGMVAVVALAVVDSRRG